MEAIYGVVLVAFTVYMLLDTFVISKKIVVVDAAQSDSASGSDMTDAANAESSSGSNASAEKVMFPARSIQPPRRMRMTTSKLR